MGFNRVRVVVCHASYLGPKDGDTATAASRCTLDVYLVIVSLSSGKMQYKLVDW